MELNQLDAKEELKMLYERLNPAELKRNIDKKLSLLYKIYKTKSGRQMVEPAAKKLTPSMVSFYMTQPKMISVS
jgi:hypothetical protein